MSQERYEAGLAVRREVLGAEYVDQAISGADSFNREFQEMATEFCWGGTWGGARGARPSTLRIRNRRPRSC